MILAWSCLLCFGLYIYINDSLTLFYMPIMHVSFTLPQYNTEYLNACSLPFAEKSLNLAVTSLRNIDVYINSFMQCS